MSCIVARRALRKHGIGTLTPEAYFQTHISRWLLGLWSPATECAGGRIPDERHRPHVL